MPKLYKIYQHKIKNVSIQFMARGHANLWKIFVLTLEWKFVWMNEILMLSVSVDQRNIYIKPKWLDFTIIRKQFLLNT